MRHKEHQCLTKNKKAILYTPENIYCEDLKEKLGRNNIAFDEWPVNNETVNFPVPVLITGCGFFSEGELMYSDKALITIVES